MSEIAQDAVVDGRYRVLSRIGAGGMAEVFLAEDVHLGRKVALKVLYRRFAEDADFVERFRREASAAAGLQHPNVVQVYDRGEVDGTYYIAMEYLSGRSLKAIIEDEGPLPALRAAAIAEQILQAVKFAHRRDIIHRDIKPQNVMVDDEGQVKVTDFGIARAGASSMTEVGAIMGTAQYLSPEQAHGQEVSERSDLYSVGVVLYEMLTGEVPFMADSAVAIALKHVSEAPRPPHELVPAVSPAMEAVTMRALAKDPAQRYRSADEFLAALHEAGQAVGSAGAGQSTAPFTAVVPVPAPVAPATGEHGPPPGSVTGDGLPPPNGGEGRRERRARWAWIAGIVVALLIGAGAAYALLKPDKVTVPDVTGQQLADARFALVQKGLKVQVKRTRLNLKEGTVFEQDPAGGERLDEGSNVLLTVSSGPGATTVPSVKGLSTRTAKDRLEARGLKADVERQQSNDVPSGKVISSDPGEGQEVAVGSRVTLVISKGPKTVQMPDLVGQDVDSATSQLNKLDLQVNTQERDSDKPPGTVVDQTPAAGTELNEGDRATLYVSNGSKLAEVPRVTGLTQATAEGRIVNAGLVPNVVEEQVDDEDDDGKVLSQSPGAGKQTKKGATVTITVGVFTPPAATP